jgi:hypothetical protein
MNSALQNLFNQAVEAQSQSKDLEALALYKEINKKGFSSAAVELNKATLYEKQQDWGRALSSVDKAQHLARSPWLASEKLEEIQKQVPSNRAYSIGSTGELSQEISKIIRPAECLFLSSILLGIYFIVRGIGFKHRGYFMCVVGSAFFLVLSLMSYSSDKTAYIISDAELKKLPIAESSSKFTVTKGAKVKILSEKGSFVKVERPGDFEGWISSSSLEK